MIWLQDAYTVSDRCRTPNVSRPDGINYIRNSVKIAVDAYDGNPVFYIADPKDPIVLTYQRIFPTLFQPMESMPDSLRKHIRYPEDLFIIQASMYGTYHMKDPEVFYNKEDLWSFPKESPKGQTTTMQPYYTIMRLPGEAREEFILMLPMVPNNRDNMIAWLAARCDGTELRQGDRVCIFEGETDLRSGADRGADRPGYDDLPAAFAVEPDGLPGYSR